MDPALQAAEPREPAANTRFALLPSAAYREVAGEIFVITADRAFHRLQTESAVLLFRLLSRGPRSAQELQDALVAHFDVDAATAHHDIAEFLLILEQRQIAVADRPETNKPSSV